MIIRSENYKQDFAKTSNYLTLQMKHPVYCLPNSLIILRQYKKTDQPQGLPQSEQNPELNQTLEGGPAQLLNATTQ